jgi:hypothetical protein
MRLITFSAILLQLAIGCGGSASRPRDTGAEPVASASVSPAAEPEVAVPAGSIGRKRLDAALRRGPPSFLAQVRVEEVIRQNKFIGWRVTQFPAEWDGSGLQPGDVVMQVNGVTPEKDTDLFNVWVSLSEASELKVAYERDGKSGEVVMPIVGDKNPETKKMLEEGMMAPPTRAQAPSTGKQKKTVVISEEAATPTE